METEMKSFVFYSSWRSYFKLMEDPVLVTELLNAILDLAEGVEGKHPLLRCNSKKFTRHFKGGKQESGPVKTEYGAAGIIENDLADPRVFIRRRTKPITLTDKTIMKLIRERVI